MNEGKNSMHELDTKKLDILEKEMKEAGEYARIMQSHVSRMKKKDGSILTEVDLEISHRILSLISKLFPECAIVSEEETTEEKKDAPFTFVLDPIDGTDVYSLGLPSFAIALGILDDKKRPVGAMINAPRFGIGKDSLFVCLDPGKQIMVDGEEYIYQKENEPVIQITMGSKSHKLFDYRLFKGKIRTFGSSILHLLLPALMPNIKAAVVEPCFVWDITSAHAILLKTGQDIKYIDGEKFEYTDQFIWNKITFKKAIFAGSDEEIEKLQKELIPLY